MNKAPLAAFGAALFLIGLVCAVPAKADKSFLTDVIQGNLAEISVGQLAQEKGGSDGVRNFGQMLVKDHSDNNDKAKSLAQSEGVAVPNDPTPEAKALHEKLSKLSGDAFDKEFAAAMVEGHKKVIEKFEAEAKGNDDVAKFAQQTLPTLKHHLETAQSLR
jgi:putative membrane protein